MTCSFAHYHFSTIFCEKCAAFFIYNLDTYLHFCLFVYVFSRSVLFCKKRDKKGGCRVDRGVVQGDRQRDLSPLYGGKRENGCRLCFGAVLGRLGRGTYRGLGKINTPTGVKVVPGFARSPPLTPEPAAVRWPRRTGQPDGTKPKGKHDRPAP